LRCESLYSFVDRWWRGCCDLRRGGRFGLAAAGKNDCCRERRCDEMTRDIHHSESSGACAGSCFVERRVRLRAGSDAKRAGVVYAGALPEATRHTNEKGAAGAPSSCPRSACHADGVAGASAFAAGAFAAAASSVAAFIDSRTRPFSSASRTLTRTVWPSLR